MNPDFWNERYEQESYVYGKAPNAFFRQELDKREAGHLLLPAEGEGRNAVYAARRGWQVMAFDQSEAGKEKAVALADSAGVALDYMVSDVLSFTPEQPFDMVGLIYAHFPPEVRAAFHRKLSDWLRPGGIIALEAFHKDQLTLDSGGPKNEAMLYDPATLASDFADLKLIANDVCTLRLQEGTYHKGEASVVRTVAQKQ